MKKLEIYTSESTLLDGTKETNIHVAVRESGDWKKRYFEDENGLRAGFILMSPSGRVVAIEGRGLFKQGVKLSEEVTIKNMEATVSL